MKRIFTIIFDVIKTFGLIICGQEVPNAEEMKIKN